jgi:hypothetical protein
MNTKAIVLAALVSVFASAFTHAAAPAGTINQLSGIVVALKPDGRQRILATASLVEVGDTLVSEADSYVRLRLDNGNEALLGPMTRLKVERFSPQESALTLVGGLVQASGGLQQPTGHRFTLVAGGTTAVVGTSSVIASYVAAPGAAVALRETWRRSSLAAVDVGTLTDGGDNLPLREVLAQVNMPLPPSATGVLAPGLHVFVIDGLIMMNNNGGSQAFSAGQFGFVRNNITPPLIVPNNPGLKFSPPPVFAQASSPANNNNNQPKPGAVDCEVR